MRTLIPVASLLILSSCSWYRDLERSMVEDDQKQARRSRSVPREQYDQLLVKYEELSKKYEQLKEKPAGSKDSLIDELNRSQSENFAQPSANVETETVNLFPTDAAPAAAAAAATTTPIEVPSDVESQLSLYRKGLALKATNPGEATKLFQQLETQAIPTVKVRAKYQIGEMLLGRGQYDLALQVFEDIINKHSESGIVLDALRGAVMASEKLGITNKRDQYNSMLNDVFGSGQGI